MTDNDLIPDDERVEGHAEPDELAEASEIPEEVPEADAVEQAQGLHRRAAPPRPEIGVEVPEADAIEQAQDAEFEDDDDWR